MDNEKWFEYTLYDAWHSFLANVTISQPTTLITALVELTSSLNPLSFLVLSTG